MIMQALNSGELVRGMLIFIRPGAGWVILMLVRVNMWRRVLAGTDYFICVSLGKMSVGCWVIPIM